MNAQLECLPCLGRNAVDAARRSTGDSDLRHCIVCESFKLLSANRLDQPPPFTARQILDIAEKHTGIADVYKEEKRRSNRLAEQLVAQLAAIPEYDPASFESRLRLAVAGNILDFGIFGDLDIAAAMNVVRSAFTRPLPLDAVQRLQEKMESAQRILYILDNCGEAVFDRVFMEPYRHKITIAVRGRPAFNDVTADDLPECRLDNFAAGWIANGPTGIPGVILDHCSPEFRGVFGSSDLIIAKGQGNFETMNVYDAPIAFLFMAKCPVVVRLLEAEMNSLQVRLTF